MKQFNLKEYLENPKEEVVTREGNPVRIICTDKKMGHRMFLQWLFNSSSCRFRFCRT